MKFLSKGAVLVIKANICSFLCRSHSHISHGNMNIFGSFYFASPCVFENQILPCPAPEYMFRRKG